MFKGMDLWMFLGLALSLVIKEVRADTWFELRLLTFNNPSGREADGDCCDWPCSDDCDPELKICFDKPDTGECSLAIRYTGHYHSNHITFADTFPNGASNPMTVKLTEPWPTTLYITIAVADEDSINADDPMGKLRKSITTTPAITKANATWNSMGFIYKYQTIKTLARVYCDNNFYGDTCMTYCVAKDSDTHGHYTCARDGSKKCMPTYHGADCKVKCIPADDDERGHFYCDGNGEHVCMKGWTGEKCLVDIDECESEAINPCFPNGNCTNFNGSYTCACDDAYTGRDCQEQKLYCAEAPCSNHSTCNNTLGGFDCICDEDWTGDLCNREVTPCTRRPCQNGGICTVISTPISSTFLCNCVGPWEGKRCSSEVRELLNDTKIIYLMGHLKEEQWDDLTAGIRNLLKYRLRIRHATIETSVTYPTDMQTRIEVYVESRDPNVVGSLDKIIHLPKDEITHNLILPLSSTQEVMKIPVAKKPDPWVKKHWYVVLIIILILLVVIGGIVVALYLFNKRRQARQDKAKFEHRMQTGSNGVHNGVPDAAVGFDNSLYFEVNQPEKVRGLPSLPGKL